MEQIKYADELKEDGVKRTVTVAGNESREKPCCPFPDRIKCLQCQELDR